MKTFWANDGEPNNEGEYVATIDLENGKPAQVFKGKTHLDVANKLMEAQMHASQRIDELKGNRTFDESKPTREVKPKVLSADERFKLSQDIQDPTKAAEAIQGAVEAAVGAPLATITEKLQSDEAKATQEEIKAECVAFAEATPEFFQCKHNAQLIVEWLSTKGKPITRNNCAIAFEHLNSIGLMVQRPIEQPATEPTPQTDGGLPEPTVITRPRAAVSSTGIRSGDSGQQPAPRTPTPKYTREDLLKMSETEYRQKLTGEPGFEAMANKLLAGDEQPAAK